MYPGPLIKHHTGFMSHDPCGSPCPGVPRPPHRHFIGGRRAGAATRAGPTPGPAGVRPPDVHACAAATPASGAAAATPSPAAVGAGPAETSTGPPPGGDVHGASPGWGRPRGGTRRSAGPGDGGPGRRRRRRSGGPGGRRRAGRHRCYFVMTPALVAERPPFGEQSTLKGPEV